MDVLIIILYVIVFMWGEIVLRNSLILLSYKVPLNFMEFSHFVI